MTDAPNRVWVYSQDDSFDGECDVTQERYLDAQEYIRADLVDQWEPIETAPTATPVLVWDEYWLMRIGYLKLDGYWVTDSPCTEDIETRINPTHWKKLPKLPKT